MKREGPQPLSEIMAHLFTARGWGRQQSREKLEEALREAVGEAHERQCRVGSLQRGTLEILVESPVLLQEFAGFRKQALLESLRQRLGEDRIKEIRFRLATFDQQDVRSR